MARAISKVFVGISELLFHQLLTAGNFESEQSSLGSRPVLIDANSLRRSPSNQTFENHQQKKRINKVITFTCTPSNIPPASLIFLVACLKGGTCSLPEHLAEHLANASRLASAPSTAPFDTSVEMAQARSRIVGRRRTELERYSRLVDLNNDFI